MTITTTDRIAGPFQGDGSTTEWPFEFIVYDKAHLRVVVADDDGERELTADSDFEVVLNDDQLTDPGGLIRYPHPDMDPPGSPLAEGETLVITTDAPAVQTAAFKSAGGFRPQTVEQRLDYLTILVQQLMERMKRVPEAGITDTANLSLGTAAQRAQRFLGFNEDGDAVFVATPAIDPDFQAALRQAEDDIDELQALMNNVALLNAPNVFDTGGATPRIGIQRDGTLYTFNVDGGGALRIVRQSGEGVNTVRVDAGFRSGSLTVDGAASIGGPLSWGGGNAIASSSLVALKNAENLFSSQVVITGTHATDTRIRRGDTTGILRLLGGTDASGTTGGHIALFGVDYGGARSNGADFNAGTGGIARVQAPSGTIELNAPTLDFNGNADISGTLAVGGAATFSSTVTIQRNATPIFTVERIGPINAVIETKTTAGSVYFGNRDGSTFAIGATSGLSSPWVSVSNGNASISGNLTVGGTITEASDARLKSDLRVIEGALDKVRQLTGYTFSTANGVRSAGVIAQDVQRVLPEAVVERQDGMLTVGYGRLLGLLIEAIKELADRR